MPVLISTQRKPSVGICILLCSLYSVRSLSIFLTSVSLHFHFPSPFPSLKTKTVSSGTCRGYLICFFRLKDACLVACCPVLGKSFHLFSILSLIFIWGCKFSLYYSIFTESRGSSYLHFSLKKRKRKFSSSFDLFIFQVLNIHMYLSSGYCTRE